MCEHTARTDVSGAQGNAPRILLLGLGIQKDLLLGNEKQVWFFVIALTQFPGRILDASLYHCLKPDLIHSNSASTDLSGICRSNSASSMFSR